MPLTSKSTERLNNFLDSYNFYSNNIDFRIVSSKAIEKFKNVQAFQLNQITNGKFYFKKDRKEILLLKYDMWSRWIYEIENLFIEMLSHSSSTLIEWSHIIHLISLADKMNDKYKEVMLKERRDFFDENFVKIWLKGHKNAYNLLIQKFRDLLGYQFNIAFPMIVENVIQMMRYTLIELHELNGVYSYFEDSETCEPMPFMIYTDLDKVSCREFDRHLIIDRLDIYREHFDIKELYIKNYSDNPFDPEIFDEIEERGIKINYRLNF